MAYPGLSPFLSLLDPRPWRDLSFLIVAISIATALLVTLIKSRKVVAAPPTVPGHWFFKNQQLIGAPWKSILIAEKYSPLYGDIIQLSEPLKTGVILNSLDAISEVLEKQSALTSDRSRNVVLLE
ncbi:hypothetical protein FRC11_003173, partial [Ceratobasidium sp. 423]